MSTAVKQAVFRADASSIIGGGHVMRCLTLARALGDLGWRCHFAGAPGTLETVPALAASGCEILVLNDAGRDEPVALGAAFADGTDLLVVDHYGWSAKTQSSCRRWARRIVVIDDLANRSHDCDILIDQNLGRHHQDYDGLVPAGALRLIGPAYALVRPEFARVRPAALTRRARGGLVERILVSMGLTDPLNATGIAIASLATLPEVASGRIGVDVVLGQATPHRACVEVLARSIGPHVVVRIEPDDIPALLSAADLCIGAGGSSTFERCVTGLPAIVLVVADNQRHGAAALEQTGAARVVAVACTGSTICAPDPELVDALVSLTGVGTARAAMGQEAARVTDGLGTNRVAIHIAPEFTKDGRAVTLRCAVANDLEQTYQWQISPGVRRYSRNRELPTRDGHLSWFNARLSAADGLFNIIEVEGAGAGVLRLDPALDGTGVEISILVAPEHHGQGIAKAALTLADRLLPETEKWARVFAENGASLKIFLARGYAEVEPGWYRSARSHLSPPKGTRA